MLPQRRGVLAVIAVSAGLLWLAFRGKRTRTEDRVTGNVRRASTRITGTSCEVMWDAIYVTSPC